VPRAPPEDVLQPRPHLACATQADPGGLRGTVCSRDGVALIGPPLMRVVGS
jgi:hypothetical protein